MQDCIATWINTDGKAYNGTVPDESGSQAADEATADDGEPQDFRITGLPAGSNYDATVGVHAHEPV